MLIGKISFLRIINLRFRTVSPTERQIALKKFYEQNSNTEHIYVFLDDTQKIRAQEISEKFDKQIENINKDRKTELAIFALVNEYYDVFVISDDPLPSVTDVEN